MNQPSNRHKEIIDYITSYVTSAYPDGPNETEELYFNAFEDVKEKWFKNSDVISEKIIRFLNLLEHDIIPYGYYTPNGVTTTEERVSNLENIVGILPNKNILETRLNKIKYEIENIKKRINFLETKIFSNREDISKMKPVITYESQISRMEKELGISGDITKSNFSSRLEYISTILITMRSVEERCYENEKNRIKWNG